MGSSDSHFLCHFVSLWLILCISVLKFLTVIFIIDLTLNMVNPNSKRHSISLFGLFNEFVPTSIERRVSLYRLIGKREVGRTQHRR